MQNKQESIIPKIRVLIVDDSALMRRVLSELISRDPNIEVVGSLGNAKFAIAMIDRLNPDIVTLDIEMPEMDGLTALSELKKKHPKLPVIMCSSLTKQGGVATLDALSRGADDYIAKPTGNGSRDEIFQQMSRDLIYKIKELVRHDAQMQPAIVPTLNPRLHTERIDILAIGVSTGGPNALTSLIPRIPANFPVPIVIVQHMPPVFTGLLADNLDKKSQIRVAEAKEGDVLRSGQVLIAPGNHHMTIEYRNNKHIVQLNQDPAENYCRPAVDVLFRSVSKQFGANALAVVMTGMGQDGALGSGVINKAGGHVLVQDEATSVVWGMPRAVVMAGMADEIIPLEGLSHAIIQRVNRKRALL